MKTFKEGFKFGLGFVLAICLSASVILIITFVFKEKNTVNMNKYTKETGVQLVTVKKWVTNDKVIFSGKISYDGKIKWKNIELSFVLKDKQGKYIGRCTDSLLRPFEFDKIIEFKSICYDMPSDINLSDYKFETFGTY